MLEPVEALPAHASGQHCDAAAAESTRDRHATTAIVARRWPDRFVAGWVEAAGDKTRNQARVGSQNLVRADHRKASPERHYDPGLHAGQSLRQHQVTRNVGAAVARCVVEPVYAPQIAGVRFIGIDSGEGGTLPLRDQVRIGELAQSGQRDFQLAQALHRVPANLSVGDFRNKTELAHSILKRVSVRCWGVRLLCMSYQS